MATKDLGRVRGYSAYEIAQKNGFSGSEQAWLASLKGEKGEAGDVDLSTYATKEELAQAQLGGSGSVDLSIYATKSELNNKANASHSHSEYATKEELAQAQLGGSGQAPDLSNYATKSDLDNKADTDHTHSDYATKSELESKADKSDLEGISGGAKTYEKFVVICVAGQSNAVGYDESPLTKADVSADTNRILELVGNSPETATLEPLNHCAHNMQDMRSVNLNNSSEGGQSGRRDGTKGIHLPLCNILLNYIPEDYGIIMIPVAYGATKVVSSNSGNSSTFWATNSQNWGPNSNYSYIVQNRIKHCLDLNPDNIFAGIVWCQGEHNISDLASLQSGFPAMVTQINTALQDYKDRTVKRKIDEGNWFIYESTPWYMNAQGGRNIWNFYKQWLSEKTMYSYRISQSNATYTSEVKTCEGNYVELPDWTPMNPYNAGTSSQPPAHFGQNAYRTVIAPRVARAMLNAGVLPVNEFDAAGGNAEEYDDSELQGKIRTLESNNSSLRSYVEQLQGVITEIAEKVGDIEVPEVPEEEVAKAWRTLTTDKMTKAFGSGSTIADGNIKVSGDQVVLLDKDVTKIRAIAGSAVSGSSRLLGMSLIQRGEDGTAGSNDWNIDVAMTFFEANNAANYMHKWSSAETKLDANGQKYQPSNFAVNGNKNKIIDLLGNHTAMNVEFELEKVDDHTIKVTKYTDNFTTVAGSETFDVSGWEGITSNGEIRFGFTGYGTGVFGMSLDNVQYYA